MRRVLGIEGFLGDNLRILSCPVPVGYPELLCKIHVHLLLRMTGINSAGNLFNMAMQGRLEALRNHIIWEGMHTSKRARYGRCHVRNIADV